MRPSVLQKILCLWFRVVTGLPTFFFAYIFWFVVIQRLLRRLLQHQFSSFFHAAIWCQSFKQPSFRNCPAVKTIWCFFVSSSTLFLMMIGSSLLVFLFKVQRWMLACLTSIFSWAKFTLIWHVVGIWANLSSACPVHFKSSIYGVCWKKKHFNKYEKVRFAGNLRLSLHLYVDCHRPWQVLSFVLSSSTFRGGVSIS